MPSDSLAFASQLGEDTPLAQRMLVARLDPKLASSVMDMFSQFSQAEHQGLTRLSPRSKEVINSLPEPARTQELIRLSFGSYGANRPLTSGFHGKRRKSIKEAEGRVSGIFDTLGYIFGGLDTVPDRIWTDIKENPDWDKEDLINHLEKLVGPK